jgi:prepilin-type N-terminal cleavage/methylation domain-containing protein
VRITLHSTRARWGAFERCGAPGLLEVRSRKCEGRASKSEIRRPKAERSPKSEGRRPRLEVRNPITAVREEGPNGRWLGRFNPGAASEVAAPTPAGWQLRISGFGFRPSFGLRPSDFGLRQPAVRVCGNRRPIHGSVAGFTLIELVISSALMALIVASAYLCLQAALSSQKLIEPRVGVFQSARVAMALMAADLRGACLLSKEFQFLGMHRMLGETVADNLDFATHNYTPRRPREGDYCQVSFYVDKEPESGKFALYRRRNPTIGLDPLSGGTREELARGVSGLRFEYFDGFDWYETWGEVEGAAKAESSYRVRSNLSGMPEAVRITLWLDPSTRTNAVESSGRTTAEPPLVFQTVARLNLAAHSQPGASSSSGTMGQNSGTSTSEGNR